MSWSDYHLDQPALCTPFPVLRGLISAFGERKEAVDSSFHSSCTVSSGAREAEAAMEMANTTLLEPGASFQQPRDERDASFRIIGKTDEWHSSGFTFMEHFDYEIQRLLNRSAYVDASGSEYHTLEQLASSAGYSALVSPDGSGMRHCLNARWAIQRRDMLCKLRYAQTPGGFAVERASAEFGSGNTPQEAYDSLVASDWTLSQDSSPAPILRCCEKYYYYDGGGYWTLQDACELTRIVPAFAGVPATSVGVMTFSAAAPDEYGDGWTRIFDPLCTTISSGMNSFVLSGGVFASWGYGSASIPAGSSGTKYSRGWQARNVRIIYDYNTTFEFREE